MFASQTQGANQSTLRVFGPIGNRAFLRKISFRVWLFVGLAIVSSLPIVGLSAWFQKSALDKEFAAVEEKHLIVAKNLSLAMSRYVRDVKTTFDLAVEIAQTGKKSSNLIYANQNLNLSFVVILNRENLILAKASGIDADVRLPSQPLIQELRTLANGAKGAAVISGISRYKEAPSFYVVKSLANGAIALAPLSPQYLIKIQKSIAFGERGHSMIVDQNGRVIAHPNAQWQAISKDASKLSVVQKMISRSTGVAQFYSPPMKADMIAGYTFVPETGWGVMVPQPVAELVAHAKEVEAAGLFIGLLSLVLVLLISWLLSDIFNRPVKSLAEASRRVSSGDMTERTNLAGILAPKELREFSSVFNQMIEDIQLKADHLTDALVKAEAGSKVKSQFMAVMSHEIRTPMNGVFSILELLEETSLNEEQREYLTVAQKSCDSLMTIINDVLDFSQLEAGKLEIVSTPMNTIAVANDVHQLFQPMADKKGVKMLIESDEKLPSVVNGDTQRIRQILFNLVGNAVKFTDQGSISTVLKYTPASTKEGFVEIAVKDTGIGIPADKHDKIFMEFEQYDSSYSRKYGGTGLGLAICKRLAELMGGRIELYSEPGKGSCFKLHLPVTTEEVDHA